MGKKKLHPKTKDAGNVIIEILAAARLDDRVLYRQLWDSLTDEERGIATMALATMLNTLAEGAGITPEHLKMRLRSSFQLPS